MGKIFRPVSGVYQGGAKVTCDPSLNDLIAEIREILGENREMIGENF